MYTKMIVYSSLHYCDASSIQVACCTWKRKWPTEGDYESSCITVIRVSDWCAVYLYLTFYNHILNSSFKNSETDKFIFCNISGQKDTYLRSSKLFCCCGNISFWWIWNKSIMQKRPEKVIPLFNILYACSYAIHGVQSSVFLYSKEPPVRSNHRTIFKCVLRRSRGVHFLKNAMSVCGWDHNLQSA